MNYTSIIVALVGRGDEGDVITEAVKVVRASGAQLIAIPINDPHAGEMSMMMDNSGPRLEEEDIRERFRVNGFKKEAESIEVRILKSDKISQALAEQTAGVDLLVLGHRKMSTFKSRLMDSVDEGIVNHAQCPVLVVQKS